MALSPEEQAELQQLKSMLGSVKRTPEEIAQLEATERAKLQKENLDSMPWWEKAAVGNTMAWHEGALGIGNMLGLVDDERLKEVQEQNAPLKSTGAGMVGNIVGQAAMTAPAGGALGAGLKGLSMASTGASMLPRALQVVGRVAGATPTRAALEGGMQAAIYADPTNRGEDAWEGAALGGALGVGAKAAGRLGLGLAKKGGDAEALATIAEQHGKDSFVPLAQAVGDDSDVVSRVVKTAYQGGLPYIPGVSSQMKSQSKKLLGDVREMALLEADHTGALANRPDLLADPEKAVEKLRKVFDNEYFGAVKKYDYSLPDPHTLKALVEKRVKAVIPSVDKVTLGRAKGVLESTLSRYSDNFGRTKNITDPNGVVRTLYNQIDGDGLLQAKNEISELIPTLRGREKIAAVEANKVIDDIIESTMKKSGAVDDLARYQAANKAYPHFKAVEMATNKAATGEFSPLQLARAARKRSPEQRALGLAAHKVLSEGVGTPSAAGRRLMDAVKPWLGGAVLTGAGMVSAPFAAATLAGGNLLASKGAQKVLMGDTALQKALINELKKNPYAYSVGGSLLRGGVIPTVTSGE